MTDRQTGTQTDGHNCYLLYQNRESVLTRVNKKRCCRREAARCFVSVSIVSLLNSVFFSLLFGVFTDAWRTGGLCRKQTCTVTVIHYCTNDRQLSIALQQSSIRRPDVRRESRFSPTTPTFGAPVRRVAVGILPYGSVWKD